MREIKFRLWCKDLEEMTEIEKMGFENNQLWYIRCIDHDKEETYFPENDDHVLMQYTNLKDKNSTEIYEGDIVKIKHTYEYPTMEGYERDWTTTIGEVAYVHAGFDIKRISKDGIEVWQGITAMECLTDMLSEWEVIGNIYENPELLGGDFVAKS